MLLSEMNRIELEQFESFEELFTFLFHSLRCSPLVGTLIGSYRCNGGSFESYVSNNNEVFFACSRFLVNFSIKFYVSAMCTCIVQVFPMKTIKDFTLSNYPLFLDVHLKQHINVFV